ncbi:hypothetical protein [Burkholderia guangdongensis]|uniref:hypothetical protein n=1 Tax=Burkholderia guangdongensis TaxID=1792500 RepID=UPI0015CB74A5|nr:hypothetical protein [Burkholderia guangdongensis]
MKYYPTTLLDRRDQATREKEQGDLARADTERAEKRTRDYAGINSNAGKWRYSHSDRQVK